MHPCFRVYTCKILRISWVVSLLHGFFPVRIWKMKASKGALKRICSRCNSALEKTLKNTRKQIRHRIPPSLFLFFLEWKPVILNNALNKKLAERDCGTKGKTCQCFIFFWWWCWKAQSGLSAKAERPWRTGENICVVIIWLITLLHFLKPYSVAGNNVEEETECSVSILSTKTKRWRSNKKVAVWDSKFEGSEGAILL